jgi:hypothetical protein
MRGIGYMFVPGETDETDDRDSGEGSGEGHDASQ